MEKILVAVDSQNMDESSVSFACYIARLTQSKLTGIFLEEPVMEEEIIFTASGGGTYIESITVSHDHEDANALLIRQENISLFRELAKEEKVEANIYLDKGVPAEEIVAESRFADALIVNAEAYFSDMDVNSPTGFVKNILHDAVCPVIISPDQFNGIDNIIFCYDGSKSSIFAIKQFTYLFPQFESKKIKILYLKNEEELATDEQRRLTEWLKYHYISAVEWVMPQTDTKEPFFNYLVDKKDDFIVMGPYGKGLLSSFFKNEGQDASALPIFVSHV